LCSSRQRKAHPYLDVADPFAALAKIIAAVPLWVIHCDAEDTVPVGESRQLVAALKAAGSSVRYTEYAGVGHGDAIDKAVRDPEFVTWLLAQHRPANAAQD
jgi:predicted peptidase